MAYYTRLPDSDGWGFWNNGVENASYIVGYDYNAKANRVVRYKFTTSDTGSNKFSFIKTGNGIWGGSITNATKLRFYVGTDPYSHLNASVNSEYHGETTVTNEGGLYTITGETVNVVLLPNTTYYLFIFPAFSNNYLAYSWNTPVSTMTLIFDGAAGLVRIDTGSELVTAIPYIDNGTKWEQAIPYIDSGTAWQICG